MEEVNEYELLYLIRQGNNLALQYLVGEYQEYFKRALSQFHVEIVNALGEEDLLQEAQLIFYLVCDRYRRDSKATFRTYSYICKKLCREKMVYSHNKSEHNEKSILLPNFIARSTDTYI